VGAKRVTVGFNEGLRMTYHVPFTRIAPLPLIRLIACGIVFAALVIASGVGCSTTSTVGNQNLTEGNVGKIVKGVTTKAEVEQMLGPPDQMTLQADGRRMMTYQGSQTSVGWSSRFVQSALPFMAFVPMSDTSTMKQQTLQIMLNREEIVEDYEFENGGSETSQTASAFSAHSGLCL
jgi:hypothetical protein